MNPLKSLDTFGQSVWLDFVSRLLLDGGDLAGMIEADGLKGMTSNPAIFEKAIAGSGDYDARIAELAEAGPIGAEALYEHLAIADIRDAADALAPVFAATGGVDGYISLEVSPYLALSAEATVAEARRLWRDVDRANLMVKVPATEPGIAAIRALIADGINVNVTLLFAQSAYAAVADAYLDGLEAFAAKGGDVSRVASVASFFVSRIDTVVDGKLDAIISGDPVRAEMARALKGKVAIANAKCAYAHYQKLTQGARWRALAAMGARPQRLLWASTGTKNPAYPDTLYVEELIGPETVNTMPPATMDAFRDHGRPRAALAEDIEGAREVLARLAGLGIDLEAIARALVEDGVRLFADAADTLLGAVEKRRRATLGARLNGLDLSLGAGEAAHREALEAWRKDGTIRRVWARDARVWTGADEASWLGWLDAPKPSEALLARLDALREEVRAAGFADLLLIGMGGSSLGPEVVARILGARPGFPRFHMIDSTNPAQIRRVGAPLDPAKTLHIVASKSGSTLEPSLLAQYFFARAADVLGTKEAGRRFVAITDPGSKLEAEATRLGYRAIFHGEPSIGGRFSVLSAFGLVPMAAIGIDPRAFLADLAPMLEACGPAVPPAENAGVRLGLAIGTLAKAGRNKLTLIADPGLAPLGAWLEQLIAESTGKRGVAIIPIDGEPIAEPARYGADRAFVRLRLASATDPELDRAAEALHAAGQPLITIHVAKPGRLGQEFFRWQMATAVAGSVLAINPFDQPDVEASKLKTRALTEAAARGQAIEVAAPRASEAALAGVRDQLKPGDYLAVLAYLDQNPVHEALLTRLRALIRDRHGVATCLGFGPRFLHSTGQAFKGGPDQCVVLHLTAREGPDLAIPDYPLGFATVLAAQAEGDLQVLAERGRRHLHLDLGEDAEAGLGQLVAMLERILGERS